MTIDMKPQTAILLIATGIVLLLAVALQMGARF